MLVNFWRLNGHDHLVLDEPTLVGRLAVDQVIENAVYQPTRFAPLRPGNLIGNKTFRNVSFRSTHLYGIEFQTCIFEDCLFMGAVFELCEFHNTRFVGCNPYKARFVSTYIDPMVFDGMLNPTRHANIGVFLFQQLRLNAFSTYQPDFAESADWRFRTWHRYEQDYKYREGLIAGKKYWPKWIISKVYELISGFGHSFFRFLLTSVFLFVAITILNYFAWRNFSTGDSIEKALHPGYTAYYLTAVTLTTLGDGNITPRTVCGMLIIAAEAIAGFFWFALLAAMLVRRVFR